MVAPRSGWSQLALPLLLATVGQLHRLQAAHAGAPAASAGKCTELRAPSPDWAKNTAAIQKLLDAASASHGVGCVSVGGGDYPVHGIFVKSNSTLRIESDTRLLSVMNVTVGSVVQVEGAEHVTIEGGGTLYGNAEQDIQYYDPKDDRFNPRQVDGSMNRPHLLLISNSHDVVVRNLHLHNSTDWNMRMDMSSNIYVDNVDIYGDSRFPNNDGFDPESCINVTLVNSRIDVADDGICPKAGAGPLRGLTVRNTTIRSHSHAIKFGSNTDSLMSDILFDNITIWDSNGGMSIQQRSEGDIVNVTWSNIIVETRYVAPRWWGNGEWLGVTANPRDNGHAIGRMRQLRFINITARSENGGLLSGISHGVKDVLFQNVHVTIAAWSNYSTGDGPPCFVDPNFCTNQSHPTCTKSSVTPGSQISCQGSRDYRPTPNGNCSYYCRAPAKADGVYLENVHGVTFKNVTFEFEGPRKKWFGRCVGVDARTTGISGRDEVKCINGAPEEEEKLH